MEYTVRIMKTPAPSKTRTDCAKPLDHIWSRSLSSRLVQFCSRFHIPGRPLPTQTGNHLQACLYTTLTSRIWHAESQGVFAEASSKHGRHKRAAPKYKHNRKLTLVCSVRFIVHFDLAAWPGNVLQQRSVTWNNTVASAGWIASACPSRWSSPLNQAGPAPHTIEYPRIVHDVNLAHFAYAIPNEHAHPRRALPQKGSMMGHLIFSQPFSQPWWENGGLNDDPQHRELIETLLRQYRTFLFALPWFYHTLFWSRTQISASTNYMMLEGWKGIL